MKKTQATLRQRIGLGVGLLIAASGWSTASAGAVTVSGNINPAAIQIDKNANLYPGDTDANILNPGARADWVKDSAINNDGSDLTDSIATGIIPGVTGAAGGTGHWNGVRIVDGLDGSDQDIFLTGGKENDLSTWNVGPGSVGSSKYDITQAYLANNQETLFFGMERRGNNGTTAFDFEFNQKAPASSYLPTRTVGDVLFTFEMQGSGGSGSATPHYFVWNGSAYIEKTSPSSMISSINNTTVKAAPWGYVDSQGNWVLGSLPRFSFAEAAVNLAQAFPNFNPCNNSAYVQVRTRSSATDTSDLKDTTKIFEYLFGGPTAKAKLDTNCDQQFTYDAGGSTDSTGGTSLTYNWTFDPPTGVTLSGTGITGPDASGNYHSTQKTGTVNVSLPTGVNSVVINAAVTAIQGTGCTDDSATVSVTVYRKLAATATLSATCDLNISYSSSVTGGKTPYTYSWQFQKNSLDDGTGTWTTVGNSSTASGTFTAPSDGTYRANLTVGDSQSPACSITVVSNQLVVREALTASAAKTSANGSGLTVTLTGTTNGATSLQWQRLSSTGTWVNISNATATTLVYSGFETDATPSAISFSIGADNYVGKLWQVQLRLHATRTVNGTVCEANSAPVTVKKVTAVDP